jgi:predicted N-acyltransferase
LFLAERDGRRIAASLIALDPGRRAAFGRYWGATEHLPNLHFDACYYQPLAWCIAQGYQRFEGGAQGEHKMARGLMPVQTHSAHYIADRRFAAAIEDFLAKEASAVAGYIDELEMATPYKGG